MPTTINPTAPQPLSIGDDQLTGTAMDGLEQQIRTQREQVDFKTTVNAFQKYAHAAAVERAKAWTS